MAETPTLQAEAMFSDRRHRAMVRARMLSLGRYQASGDFVYTRHQHLDYEAIVVVRGAYRCRLNAREVRVRPGEILLVKAMDWHEDLLVAGVTYWALSFSLEGPALRTVAGWFAEGVTPQQQVCVPERGSIAPILTRMQQEASAHDSYAPLILDAMLGELAWRLARSFPRAVLAPALGAAAAQETFADRLERWFAGRPAGEVRVGEMARAMGLGATAFAERCRRELGVTPARAYARYRLARAHQLLAGTAMTVVEVADHLGFSTPFHFSRAFRRQFGHPPSQVPRGKP
jgi:AraC-like DNA-binding protein